MVKFHIIIFGVLTVIGLLFKKNKIKDIKLFNLSVTYLILIAWGLIFIITEFIIPLPTYYIKAKDERYIENIIEREMAQSNIHHDKGSLKIVNQFIGKYNQLYFCTYEINGEEEARMFDFKENIFGNLKPSHDFSESKVVLKDEIDDGMNYRRFGDGLAAFHINYGYANNPEEFDNLGFGKFVVRSLNPESYYFIIQRFDDWSPLIFQLVVLLIFGYIVNRKEKSKVSYTEVKYFGKKNHRLVFEYYA